jgi:hypothetical protein
MPEPESVYYLALERGTDHRWISHIRGSELANTILGALRKHVFDLNP